LVDISALETLTLWVKSISHGDMLASHPSLHSLTIGASGIDVHDLIQLPNLKSLYLVSDGLPSVEFVRDLPLVNRLGLGGLYSVSDYSPIGTQVSLDQLELFNCRNLTNIDQLRPLQALTNLGLSFAPLRGDLADLVETFPGIKKLRMTACDWITEIRPLADLNQLESLALIQATQFANLEPVKEMKNLRLLNISKTAVTDLSPLAGCRNLYRLDISGCTNLEDVSVLNEIDSLRLLIISAESAEPRGISELREDINVMRTHIGSYL
jgi:internalin A